jgi:hypothetical protein
VAELLTCFSELMAVYVNIAVAVPLVGGDASVAVKEPSGFREIVAPDVEIVWAVVGQLVAPTGAAQSG